MRVCVRVCLSVCLCGATLRMAVLHQQAHMIHTATVLQMKPLHPPSKATPCMAHSATQGLREFDMTHTCTTSDTSGKSRPRAMTSLANITAVGLLPKAAAALSRCFWLSRLCRSYEGQPDARASAAWYWAARAVGKNTMTCSSTQQQQQQHHITSQTCQQQQQHNTPPCSLWNRTEFCDTQNVTA